MTKGGRRCNVGGVVAIGGMTKTCTTVTTTRAKRVTNARQGAKLACRHGARWWRTGCRHLPRAMPEAGPVLKSPDLRGISSYGGPRNHCAVNDDNTTLEPR